MKTAEEFVAIWERAKSIAEVVAATGASAKTCSVRAYRYRKLGVPLRKFPRGRYARKPLDIQRLIALAESAGNGAAILEDRP